ncbi:hypothetical protein P7C70_g8435, partial [Phenoliferia sp. Uapishka_3]
MSESTCQDHSNSTHDHSSHESNSAELDSFEAANKHHHNEAGHSHSHANSTLNVWLAGTSQNHTPERGNARGLTRLPTAGRIAEAVLDEYDFDEDSTTLLDFACGSYVPLSSPHSAPANSSFPTDPSGLISQALSPHCARIIGVDISPKRVEEYSLAASNQGIDKEEMMAVQKDRLVDEDAELGGEKFDVVLCAQAYHHILDIDATTMALSRRVKPGGVLIVVDLDNTSGFAEMRNRAPKKVAEEVEKVVAHKSGFSPEELKKCFEKTGRFESVTVDVALSTMLSEMAAKKGKDNWAEGMVDGKERPDVEVRHLIVVGVRSEQ